MASPTKPPAPVAGPLNATETEREFEAAVERVQRRETTAPRKGFDEERQPDEQARDAVAQDEEKTLEPLAPGAWTPFSGD
jgi:hypothetical protein